MCVTVVAMVVLVLAALELAAFPARLMRFASEAPTVAGSVAWHTCRPRSCWIFAIAKQPFGFGFTADPTVQTGMRIDMPRWRRRQWALGLAFFLE